MITATLAAVCMALAINGEARGESVQGQIAVGQVIMHRVADKRWPNTVCGVVTQKRQFEGMPKSVTLGGKEDWQRFIPLSQAIIEGYTVEQVPKATHFHADYAHPYWAKKMDRVRKIGGHIFYAERPRQSVPRNRRSDLFHGPISYHIPADVHLSEYGTEEVG